MMRGYCERDVLTMAESSPAPLPPIEVEFPDLSPHAAGNTGIAYAWSFAARRVGPHVLLQALTHGNEVCGAIALDWMLREGMRPARVNSELCRGPSSTSAVHRRLKSSSTQREANGSARSNF